MWDERYSVDEYVYGKAPNDFLRENLSRLKAGKVLCLGAGEGRNAVFLAKHGYEVTALDASFAGLKKAEKLAHEEGVQISTLHADLRDYAFASESWDSIVSIYCHLPPQFREKVHHGVVTGLKEGGIFLLEAYTPQQVNFGTGGPPTADLMVTLKLLESDLTGLTFLYGIEKTRGVVEGVCHQGNASVVQFIARKAKRTL